MNVQNPLCGAPSTTSQFSFSIQIGRYSIHFLTLFPMQKMQYLILTKKPP